MTGPIIIQPLDRARIDVTPASPGPIVVEQTGTVPVPITLIGGGPRGAEGPPGPPLRIYQLPPAP